jgi:hypothetical protein
MTLEQLGSISEAVGAIAVVVSLLFLGIELRRNTRSVRAASAYDSDAAYAAINREMAADENYALALYKAMSPNTTRESLSVVVY